MHELNQQLIWPEESRIYCEKCKVLLADVRQPDVNKTPVCYVCLRKNG